MPSYEILGDGQIRWRAGDRRMGGILILTGAVFAVFGIISLLSAEQREAAIFVGILCHLVMLVGLYFWMRRLELEIGPEGLSLTRRTLFGSKQTQMPGVQVAGVRMRVELRGGHVDEGLNYQGLHLRYVVELLLGAEGFSSSLGLMVKRREISARTRGSSIAAALKVPFIDAIGDEMLELAPQGAQGDNIGAGLEIRQEGYERCVYLRGLMPWRSWGVLFAGWLMGMGACVFTQDFMRQDLPEVSGEVAVFIFLFQAALSFWLVAGVAGVLRISVGEAGLQLRKTVLGIPFRRIHVPKEAVENLRVQTLHPMLHGLAIVLPDRTVLVGRRAAGLLLWEIRAWLALELWGGAGGVPSGLASQAPSVSIEAAILGSGK
ncbi:MAG: hypothetical protein ACYTG5_04850 [Planctomycetota bacterium]|jgi:hypothetical protein